MSCLHNEAPWCDSGLSQVSGGISHRKMGRVPKSSAELGLSSDRDSESNFSSGYKENSNCVLVEKGGNVPRIEDVYSRIEGVIYPLSKLELRKDHFMVKYSSKIKYNGNLW